MGGAQRQVGPARLRASPRGRGAGGVALRRKAEAEEALPSSARRRPRPRRPLSAERTRSRLRDARASARAGEARLGCAAPRAHAAPRARRPLEAGRQAGGRARGEGRPQPYFEGTSGGSGRQGSGSPPATLLGRRGVRTGSLSGGGVDCGPASPSLSLSLSGPAPPALPAWRPRRSQTRCPRPGAAAAFGRAAPSWARSEGQLPAGPGYCPPILRSPAHTSGQTSVGFPRAACRGLAHRARPQGPLRPAAPPEGKGDPLREPLAASPAHRTAGSPGGALGGGGKRAREEKSRCFFRRRLWDRWARE